MNPDFGKNSYESIPIPEKLNEIVAQTIASRNKEEIYMSYENTNKTDKTKPSHPVWKGCMAAAAAFLVAGTIGLNVSPAFAEEMAKRGFAVFADSFLHIKWITKIIYHNN